MTKKKLTFEDLPAAMARLLEDVAKIKKMLKAQEAAAKKGKMAEQKPEPAPTPASTAAEIGIEKACELLNRSKQTIYMLVRSGALSARKQGARLIFSTDQLAEYADQHKKTASKRPKTRPVSRARKQTAKHRAIGIAGKPAESRPKREQRGSDRSVQPSDPAPQSVPVKETV